MERVAMPTVCSDSVLPFITEQGATFAGWKGAKVAEITQMKSWANLAAGLSDTQTQNYEILQKNIFDALACMQEKLTQEGSTTNQIHTAQARIMELQEQLKDSEEEIQIAKDRVAYIRDPDARPSYYQSWFPMDHPMRPSSVPIFLGIVVFGTVMIVLGLLSVLGLNISLGSAGAPPSALGLALQWLRAQLTIPFWIMLAILIGVVIYFRQ
jgi:hypothetical protein